MAFDFLGTMTRAQFNKLKDFAMAELKNVNARRAHLAAEIERVDQLIAKLYKASFKVSAVEDIKVRWQLNREAEKTKVTDARIREGMRVNIKAISQQAKDLADLRVLKVSDGLLEISHSKTIKGGEVIEYSFKAGFEGDVSFLETPEFLGPTKSPRAANDAFTGVLVEDMKSWIIDQIKYKRERLEFKIKKAKDLKEQLEKESKLILRRSKQLKEDLIDPIEEQFAKDDFRDKNLFEKFIDPETGEDVIPRLFPVSTYAPTIKTPTQRLPKKG